MIERDGRGLFDRVGLTSFDSEVKREADGWYWEYEHRCREAVGGCISPGMGCRGCLAPAR